MRFFVPNASEPDAAWEDLRRRCGAPDSPRRIYSIVFDHDGAQHEATVGLPVQPTEGGRQSPGVAGATVAAIFEGDPYHVCQIMDGPQVWASSFVVGRQSIRSKVYFDAG